MAKCGCASDVCSCVIISGESIRVAGNGTTSNPYVIDFDGFASTNLIVQDSATVDMTLTGNGSTANPYILSAVATIPPATDSTPPGVIVSYGGISAPTGWMLCDGAAINRTTYSDLFAVFGTTYGIGNGTTTFNLPNLKGRVPVGLDITQVEFDARGEVGGAKAVALTTSEIPAHAHDISHDHGNVVTDVQGDHTHGFSFKAHSQTPESGNGWRVLDIQGADGAIHGSTYGTGTNGGGSHQHNVDLPPFGGSSGAAGSGSAHQNLQPYIVLNYIVKI